MQRIPTDICYLCGRNLADEPWDDDHVPPKQIYPEVLRSTRDSPMRTLPTHKSCNNGYSRDEVYFTLSLVPLAPGSQVARLLIDERGTKCLAGKQKGLFPRVLQEFEARPSGILLPHGLMLKRFDGERVYRVIWKIIRGLHFLTFRRAIPGDTPTGYYQLYEGGRMPSAVDLQLLASCQGLGPHPDIFDYKFLSDDESPRNLFWALRFWGQIIVTFAYQCEDPFTPTRENLEHAA